MNSARRRADYDSIATRYDQRYEGREPVGVRRALLELVQGLRDRRVLEVGCGTGHWLWALAGERIRLFGVDRSTAMLSQARSAPVSGLARADAAALPFVSGCFDLVYCVNALHHFEAGRAFVAEARRLLVDGGPLAVVGMNPRAGRDRWYLYDYFPGTRQRDEERYPSCGAIADWMIGAGFDVTESRVAHRFSRVWEGEKVLDDPSLQKHGTSQLMLLRDDEYALGMRRIREALDAGRAGGEPPEFVVDITLFLTVGRAR